MHDEGMRVKQLNPTGHVFIYFKTIITLSSNPSIRLLISPIMTLISNDLFFVL